jgi:preprotein translocase subunit SecF
MFNFNIIGNRKIWLTISGILVSLSLVALFSWGLNFGIDFTGGSLLEVSFSEKKPSSTEVRDSLSGLELSSLTIQPTEEGSLILRFKNDDPQVHGEIMEKLNILAGNASSENLSVETEGGDVNGAEADVQSLSLVEELRFDSVGPSIGKELRNKSFNTIFLVLIIIILYISLVFRKVSKPVSSWKYGIASIIALFHDILIVLGIFAVLGRFYNVEINTPFIAAILTVLGYSINDTIIVFDRIRENLPKSVDNFTNTINKSVNQTLVRSINTSFTTLLVLLAIIIFGGGSIREFVLALAIGIFIGTYSSIFIASPVLVWFDSRRK